jgi:bacterioferritin
MKENKNLITVLNSLLADELTAINQYMVHSEMCENLGYSKLHQAFQKLAMDQMLLAERLIERISYLDGSVALAKLNSILIGKTVSELIINNKSDESEAFRPFTDAIELASETSDHETVDLLSKILRKEKVNVGWAELQRSQIAQMGMETYLSRQT